MNMIKIILMIAFIAVFRPAYAQDTTAQPLQKVLTSYLNVKNYLTKSSPDSVCFYAKELSINVRAVSMETLSDSQHIVWMQYYEVLGKDADAMGSSTDLKSQRKSFTELSSALYKALKTLNINSVDLFYQYCPMADAYWISEKSKIANPYYGRQMLSCGSTKDTIRAISQ